MSALKYSIFCCLIGTLLISPAAVRGAEKYALLVGVTKYQHSQMNSASLEYPEADATAVGDLLNKSGYKVKVLLGKSATQKAIQAELKQLAGEGVDEGVVLIGLFGHGVQYGSDAYYGSYDTKIRTVTDAAGNVLREKNGSPKLEPDPASMISMRSILDALTACGAGNRVLLADCCRNDPSAARGRAFGSQLRVSDLPAGTAALFACSANERAFEHKDWGHGAFTSAFLTNCQSLSHRGPVLAGNLSEQVYTSVKSMVRDKTGGRDHQTVNPLLRGIVDLQLTTEPSPGTVISNSLGMKLAYIPAGEFLMGSPVSEKDREDNETQHRVKLTQPFYLGMHEVTLGQFRQFVSDTGYKTEAETDGEGGWGWNATTEKFEGRDKKYTWRSTGFTQTDEHPVVNVTWNDAVKFCAWLSKKEERNYRLPTEAEWEYACRGETTTAYFFGDDPAGLATAGNVADATAKPVFKNNDTSNHLAQRDGFVFTSPVGKYRSNRFGLYDMHGNVWEWCSDWYHDYPATGVTFVTDPQGSRTGSFRVFRGGSWSGYPLYARSAYRNWRTPDSRFSDLGFRLAFSPAGPGK